MLLYYDMKKWGIILLFLFPAGVVTAQDSTVYRLNRFFEVINNTDFNYLRIIKKLNDSTWEQFDYIRGGNPYQRTLFRDSLLKKRHGVYTRYENRGKTWYSGSYHDNEPVGAWYFYSLKNGRITDSLNYSYYASLEERITSDTDAGAGFPGGAKGWKRYLDLHLREMETEHLIGRYNREIIVSFVIGEGGKLIHVNPVKSIHPEVDLEVIKVIRDSPPWKTTTEAGKGVLHIRTQKILF